MELLIVLGIFIGFIAGFFGVGGGTVLIPTLMYMGYPIQQAIPISIIQMFISSSMGSFLNYKIKNIDLSDALYLGIGGLVGGYFSPYIVAYSSTLFLEFLFLMFIVIAFAKFIYTPSHANSQREVNKALFVAVGILVGLTSTSVGIGGAMLITPFLYAYMGYELRHATAMSLFYIFFTSLSSASSWLIQGNVLYQEALILGFSSIVGVWLGIYLTHKVKVKILKLLLLGLYTFVLVFIVNRIFFS